MKEDAGIQHEDQLVTAFNLLADKVHPLALGNVKRSISQSRMMAKKLLGLHMDPSDQAHKVATIVDNLTSKLFFHGHPINRTEARELGLENVEDPSDAVERAMWQLYLEYEKEMQLTSPFNAAAEFLTEFPQLQGGGAIEKSQPKVAKLAYVESESHSDLCRMEYELVGQKLPNLVTSVNIIQNARGWIREG